MTWGGSRGHLLLFALVCVVLQVYVIIHNSMIIHNSHRTKIGRIDRDTKHQNKYIMPNVPRNKITAAFIGRLGNRMFEYASMLGVAHHNNLTAVVAQDFYLFKSFDLKTNTIKNTTLFTSQSRKYREVKGCTFESRVMSLGPEHNVTLHGYFQSWKYFHHINEIIRENFQWKKSIKDNATQQLHQLTKSLRAKYTIGVHVRRADMAKKKSLINMGYVTVDKGYFDRALKYFRVKYKDVSFVVVSDDLPWCRQNIEGHDVTFVSNRNPPQVDMAILSMCNHTVISTGSFGWWAGWLAGGEVIYSQLFPKPNSRLSKIVNLTDYWPPSWIAM